MAGYHCHIEFLQLIKNVNKRHKQAKPCFKRGFVNGVITKKKKKRFLVSFERFVSALGLGRSNLIEKGILKK